VIDKRTYRALLALITGLFLCLQTYSVAHASAYDGPHEHSGIVCSIGVLAQDEQVMLPAQCLMVAKESAVPIAHDMPVITIIYVSPQGRAPPPRSPPFHNQ